MLLSELHILDWQAEFPNLNAEDPIDPKDDPRTKSKELPVAGLFKLN